MMTIKDLKDILIHFQDKEYDDYNIVLWDYNHQQSLNWGGSYSLNKPDKILTFPVDVPPVDNQTIIQKLQKLIDNNTTMA